MGESYTRKTAVLVGAGMVAGTHVAACAAASDKLRLKGVVSRRRASAQQLADHASQLLGETIAVYDSLEKVTSDDELDIAIIVTPPNARADIIRPLAEAGKAILLEKPIGRTLAESQEVVEICEEAGVALGIVFQHRVRAASIKAITLVQSGELGALGVVQVNVPWWREQSYYDEPGRGTYSRDGGGVLISQAIHTMDLALSLTGPVHSVLAMSKTTKFHTMESEDFVVTGLEFANGAVGSLVASTASFPGSAESITLHFEKASLHLEAGQLIVSWRNGSVDTFGDTTSTGGGADPMAFTHEWHQAILENFVEHVNGKPAPIVSGQEALHVHALIEAINRSAQTGSIQHLGS